MKIKTHLLVKWDREAAQPHGTSILEIPLKYVYEHPRLEEIFESLPEKARLNCQEEGRLLLSYDYAYAEYYRNGVGMVIRNLKLNPEKLSAEEKQSVQNWLNSQYEAYVHTDGDLSSALANPSITRHVITDMTVAGMALDSFKQSMENYEKHGEAAELPYPLEIQDIERISASLQARNITNLEAYYWEVAMVMRDEWPSPKDHNYGYGPGKARINYFKGFEALGEAIIKAGPYAKQPAWPHTNLDHYDNNGIGRDENGDIIPYDKIEVAENFTFYPYLALSASYEGEEAIDVIERLDAFTSTPPLYDGFDSMCYNVGGKLIFGDEYKILLENLTGSCVNAGFELPQTNITYSKVVQGVLRGNQSYGDIDVMQIMVNPETLTADDKLGVGMALEQISNREARQQQEKALIDKIEQEQDTPHYVKLVTEQQNTTKSRRSR